MTDQLFLIFVEPNGLEMPKYLADSAESKGKVADPVEIIMFHTKVSDLKASCIYGNTSVRKYGRVYHWVPRSKSNEVYWISYYFSSLPSDFLS